MKVYISMSLFEVLFFAVTLTIISSDLTKSLTILKDAHVLFSASNDRIASFSAQEWENWFKVLKKVPAIFCQLCPLFILSQIFDHANIFVSKHSYVELLLRAYRTARSLLFRNEDGVLVIHRVMDFCSECADLSQKCQSPKIPFSPLFICVQAQMSSEKYFSLNSLTTG